MEYSVGTRLDLWRMRWFAPKFGGNREGKKEEEQDGEEKGVIHLQIHPDKYFSGWHPTTATKKNVLSSSRVLMLCKQLSYKKGRI